MEVPAEIKSLLSNEEKIDFCVKSKLQQKHSTSISQVFGGIFFIAFPLSILYLMLRKMFKTNSVLDMISEFSWSVFWDLTFPIIVLSIFLILGLMMFFGGIIYFFIKGGYFIGTNHRFITYRKGEFKSYDWEQFIPSGVEIQLPDNLSLKLRTGKIHSSGSKKKNNYSESFVHDQIHLVGINNVNEIAQMCGKRIDSNAVNG